jgi:DNA-entry nuclease
MTKISRIIFIFLVIALLISITTGCLRNGKYQGEVNCDSITPSINGSAELLASSYEGYPYVAVNGNIPYFSNEERANTSAFETYSSLDELGRCGVAYANICQELMPTEDRESLSSVTPSGWKNKKYDFVDGGWLYNRAHIIGFQLAGEQANKLNLITGTRYFNVAGMLVF